MWKKAAQGAIIGLLVWLFAADGAAKAGHYRAPRTSAGKPDLSGLWTSDSLTELERPPAFKALVVTDAEASTYEKNRRTEFASTAVDDAGGRATNAAWWKMAIRLARIDGKVRTSWLVDPTDGRLPYTSEGKVAKARQSAALNDSSNPETRAASERCLLAGWAAAGPPMLNAPYSNLYQIVQTRDDVAISMEANHDVRIVRLKDAHHVPTYIRPWMGDSVGRWEGESLVVETTNFNAGDASKPPSGLYISMDAKVTERFTRIARDRLLYEFAVEDPKTFAKTWRAEMLFELTNGPMYEYACHEGNYSLPGILAGARYEETKAKDYK